MNNVSKKRKAEYCVPSLNEEMFPGFSIPNEVAYEIFSYLRASGDLVTCAMVCQLWKQMVDSPGLQPKEEDFPDIFGAKKWEQYLGVPEKAPPLRLSIFRDYDPKKHLLTLIPKTVNGEPLTLKSIEELVKKPMPDTGKSITKYGYIYHKILEHFGDKTAENTHWLLLTKTVVEGTRDKSYFNQQGLVKKQGMKISELIGTVVSIFAHNISSADLIYTQGQQGVFVTFTRVQESFKMDGSSCQIIVGGFSASGLDVNYLNYDADNGLGLIGVAGARKSIGT